MKFICSIAFGLLVAVVATDSIASDSKASAGQVPATVIPDNSVYAQRVALMEKTTREIDATHKRTMEMAERGEKDLARQEQNIARWEKILDTWERQQAQYQKYLDSLSTSKEKH